MGECGQTVAEHPDRRLIEADADARLMYLMSCKGAASYELLRDDPQQWSGANIVPRTAHLD